MQVVECPGASSRPSKLGSHVISPPGTLLLNERNVCDNENVSQCSIYLLEALIKTMGYPNRNRYRGSHVRSLLIDCGSVDDVQENASRDRTNVRNAISAVLLGHDLTSCEDQSKGEMMSNCLCTKRRAQQLFARAVHNVVRRWEIPRELVKTARVYCSFTREATTCEEMPGRRQHFWSIAQ